MKVLECATFVESFKTLNAHWKGSRTRTVGMVEVERIRNVRECGSTVGEILEHAVVERHGHEEGSRMRHS